jgi:ATP-binding cassette subfamily B protein
VRKIIMKSTTKNIKNIFWLVKPYWKYGKIYMLGKLVISIFIAPVLALIEVTLIQAVIDAITVGATLKATLLIAVSYEAAYLGTMMIQWAFLLFYDRWKAVDIQIKINRSIYEQAIITDYKYFDNPEFYNNYTFAVGEFAAKSTAALDLLLRIFAIISVVAAMTAYIAILGPWIMLIGVAGAIAYTLTQNIIGRLGVSRAKDSLPHERKMAYVHRVAYQKQYAADLKSTNLKQHILSLFDKSGNGKVGIYKKYATPFLGANMLLFSTYTIFELAQLVYLIVCAFTRNLSVGAITGLFAAAKKLNSQLTQFAVVSGQAVELSLYAEKIKEFFNLKSEIETSGGNISPSGEAFSVELKNLCFKYANSNFGLKNINLKINPGEKIAIVGENGAGKTTLSKLLLRLYDVDGGNILYNGVSIRDYDTHKLRRKIGVAFQEPQIYALTVRKNMEVYNTADDSVLLDALEKVGLNIELDSEVMREFDDSGIMFSGGQSQKFGLTRLLHGDFGLLLLDEPSSALDPIAEYNMTKLIFEQSNTTTIMVAHRLSTIRDADRIILIEDGEIKETGTHDELMNLNSRYCEMFTKQAENYIKQ